MYFREADKGGHFAAQEQPTLFAEEVRASFRTTAQTGAGGAQCV
jgi:pimeloyl-ACP methyl ester carboxylesterase